MDEYTYESIAIKNIGKEWTSYIWYWVIAIYLNSSVRWVAKNLKLDFSRKRSVAYKDLGVIYREEIVEAVEKNKIRRNKKNGKDLEKPLKKIKGVFKKVTRK